MLHHLLLPELEVSRSVIGQFSHLLGPVQEEMLRMRYAWDATDESWFRTFEEHMMRAAEIWVSYANDHDSLRQAVACDAGYGFIYVPVMVEHFQSHWLGIENMQDFIVGCLSACRGHVDHC
jgi:hypothetical protein